MFNPDFQEIYDRVKGFSPNSARIDSSVESWTFNPRLVPIGDGTFALDSISSPSGYSAEIQLRYCLEKLICTIPNPLI